MSRQDNNMNKLQNKHVVIVGGSSGIGLAIAENALQNHAVVTIASRSNEKLSNAKSQLLDRANTYSLDYRDENQLINFFNQIGHFDHLIISAAEVNLGTITEMPISKAKEVFNSKFWGSYQTIKHALSMINKNGSIILFSGRLSQRPTNNGSSLLSAVNSAIEGLGRALALELSPIRVNVIAPGFTQTKMNQEPCEAVNQQYATICEQFIIKRPAEPNEIALAAIYLMENTYATGSTLFVDGGYTFR